MGGRVDHRPLFLLDIDYFLLAVGYSVGPLI